MGRGGRWDWNADAVQRLSLVKWIRTGLFTSPCLSLIRIYPRPGPFSRILKPRAESLFVFLPWLEGYQLTGIYLQLLTRPPEAESKSQI